MCLLPTDLAIPPNLDPPQPYVFPGQFPDESFWFQSGADFAATGLSGDPSGIVTVIEFAIEGAFAAGPVISGDQVAFTRIRIRIDADPTGTGTDPGTGTYVVTHPYGVDTFTVDTLNGAGTNDINMTRDVGIASPGDFVVALGSNFGPFLLPFDPVSELVSPPVVVGSESFIADPGISTRVTGSPFGTNRVTITRNGTVVAETDMFTLMGKIHAGLTPTPLAVERMTYSRNAAEDQIDAFATAPASATVSFAPPGAAMTPDLGGHFFGQVQGTGLTIAPVTVSANNPPLNDLTTSDPSDVTDVVTITKAEYDPGSGLLVIEAVSSDEASPPTLTAADGLGPLLGTGPTKTESFTVSIPPATVTVTSGANGSDTEEVVILP